MQVLGLLQSYSYCYHLLQVDIQDAMGVVCQSTVLYWLTLSSLTLSVPLSEFFDFNTVSSCNYSDGVTENDIFNSDCTEIIFPSVINVSIPYGVPVRFPFFDTIASEIHVSLVVQCCSPQFQLVVW